MAERYRLNDEILRPLLLSAALLIGAGSAVSAIMNSTRHLSPSRGFTMRTIPTPEPIQPLMRESGGALILDADALLGLTSVEPGELLEEGLEPSVTNPTLLKGAQYVNTLLNSDLPMHPIGITIQTSTGLL
jgi:hypothetical protein